MHFRQTHPNLAQVAFRTAYKGDLKPVLDLLHQGADPNIPDRNGDTALLYASRFDRLEMVRALLQAGADVNRRNPCGLTPLMVAPGAAVATALLKAGACVDIATPSEPADEDAGRTALMIAARRGRTAVVQVLLTYGADLHRRDSQGRNALMHAAEAGQNETAQWLAQVGAEVGFIETALLGEVEAVREYLRAGIELHSDQMATALWWAAGRGNTAVVALLAEAGADIDAPLLAGTTALMRAAAQGRLQTVRDLLLRGADVDAIDHQGATALLYCLEPALMRRYGTAHIVQVVQMLLDGGADANIAAAQGVTPLLCAALLGWTEIVELLLDAGADPNAQTEANAFGASLNALAVAVSIGDVDTVKVLLSRGADPALKEGPKPSPLTLATDHALACEDLPRMREITTLLEATLRTGSFRPLFAFS